MSGIRHSPYSTQTRGQRRQRSVRAIPTQNTWTHDIILLAQKDDCVTPSREELDQLKLAGLGKRRIVFQKNGDHDHFLKTLEKEYPKLLSQRGAIEVLRSTTGGAGTRPLSVVPLGPKGYAVQELKAAFGAAAVYVRPVQSDLDQSVDSSSIGRFNVQCVHCQQRIPLCDLREHQDYCGCSFDDEIEVLDNLRSSSISENGSRLAENENAHQSISSPVTTGDSVSISSAPMHQEQSNQDFQSVAGGSSTGTRNMEMEIGVLCEMFPSHERTYLSELLSRHSNIDEALEQLMEETSLENKSAQNLSEILGQFQQLVNEDELHFEVQRDCVWSYAIAFYKKALGDKERLKKKLVVSFEGEEGVDAGAISAEFFRIALEQSKKRLFQGGLERVVPVKDATKLMLFRLFGMLLGHSIQQGGPCFPCLCPAVFQYIVGRTEEVQVESRKDDIPVTASTEPLLKLIDDLDNSATKESLEEVLDNDTAWAIISASHWPDTTVVSLSNKAKLVNNLIEQALVWSRKQELDEMVEGLNHVGLLRYLRAYPNECKSLLCYSGDIEFGVEEFEACLDRSHPPNENFAKQQAYAFFNEYIKHNEIDKAFPGCCRLKALLQFATGYQVPPPGERLPNQIKVKYLEDDDTYKLPIAQSCFGILSIPTVHETQRQFNEMMDTALKHASSGFGLL